MTTSLGKDSRQLCHLTTDEVARAIAEGTSTALLPVGSTEAHGPHLPLATDVIISEAASLRAATLLGQAGVASLVLPAIPYAVTEFVGSFRGTISVRAETIGRLIEDIARSLFRQGFSRVVLINGHLEPEHARMLKQVAQSISSSADGKVIFPDQRRPPTVEQLGEEFGQGGGHAGGYETSLVMAARRDLVDDGARRDLPDNVVDIAARMREGATDAVSAGGPYAYFGRPAEATVAEGERLIEVLAEMVRNAVTKEIQESPS